jgi:TolB-like protein/DNA-binding winged helix-turn-helix (wHTH) protein
MIGRMKESKPDGMDLDAGFALAGVSVIPRQFVIVRDGERVKLEPKVMAILLELARQPGEVVGRTDFADTVWQGRVVSDEVLSRNISILRGALGDSAKESRFIQTIPTVGYRLVADVGELESNNLRWRGWPIAGGLAFAAIVSVLLYVVGSRSPSLPQTTIAVLPFENLSDTRDAEYFSDGLTDEIIGALSRSAGLLVVARTSSFSFRDRDEDVRVIGEILGAGSILEGSVRKSGDLLRVSARLVSANDGLQLWSESFNVELKDVFVIQEQISRAIVERLVGTLAPNTQLTVANTSNLEAYQLFLRANHQINRRGTATVARGVELYEEAIALDPSFARGAETLGHMSARLLGARACCLPRHSSTSESELSRIS